MLPRPPRAQTTTGDLACTPLALLQVPGNLGAYHRGSLGVSFPGRDAAMLMGFDWLRGGPQGKSGGLVPFLVATAMHFSRSHPA